MRCFSHAADSSAVKKAFVPSSGDAFDVVTYGSVQGTLAVTPPSGLTLTTIYDAMRLTLQVP